MAATKKEIDEMRSRISSLEQDNETLMEIFTNISKVFASMSKPQNDVLAPFPLGDSKKIDATVRKIEKMEPINAAQLALLVKYTDNTVFAEADFLRERIATAFGSAYFRIHKAEVARAFSFDEIKDYIQQISTMEDKIDVQSFVKGLKL
jgi:hypothetical protein